MIFEVERNDVPVTTMSCERTPAVIEPGATDVICGAKTVSGVAVDVALLSVTDTCSVPGDAISVAETFVTSAPLMFCVVERGTPLTFTIEVALKFVPVTVSWKPLSPEMTDAGAIVEIFGTAVTIEYVTGTDVPAFATTAIWTSCAVARSELVSIASSSVGLMYWVARGEPSTVTIEFDVKFWPKTAITGCVAPTVPCDGLMAVMAGTLAATMVSIDGADVAGRAFPWTVTVEACAATTSPAASGIASCVALMYFVPRAVVSSRMMSSRRKPEPLISTLSAVEFTGSVDGSRLVITGAFCAVT